MSLVAILDADKEGFLRSAGSLIQTMGRAARHLNGHAILYADVMTQSMRRAIDETNRRRTVQRAYNEANGIVPQSIIKPIDMNLVAIAEGDYVTVPLDEEEDAATVAPEQMGQYLIQLEERMREAARKFDFKQAAAYRDRIKDLKGKSCDGRFDDMKVCKRAGLVGAGGVNQSFLARMPALLGRLGPVKGSTLRVSRRIANGLRAGFAVSDYAELQPCEWIWIFVPEGTLDRVVADLAAEVAMPGKMVVLCDVLRDSLGPSPMRTAGARLATINCVPESDEQVFVAEGHPAVIAELRKHLAVEGRKLIELRPAAKTLYLSGVHMGAHLLMPWIAGAVESFRAAGFPAARRRASSKPSADGAAGLRKGRSEGMESGRCRAPLPGH